MAQRITVCQHESTGSNPTTFKLIINIISNKAAKNTMFSVKAMVALMAKHMLVADKAGREARVQIPPSANNHPTERLR